MKLSNETIILAVVAVVAGFLIFNLADKKSEIILNEDKSTIIAEETMYDENTMGYLARPNDNKTYPALILIHEWWGLNEDIKSIARRFAQEGYVALAVDMYSGEITEDPNRARELSGSVRNNVDEAFANLAAAVDFLKWRDDVDIQNIASVGWCFGGAWAYQMALNNLDIKGSVMYYGQFNPDDDFNTMRADILGHFGEEDASIAVNNVREFQAALNTVNGMHEVYIYPNVGHGFANLRGGTNLAYSEEEAELAWQRTQNFLTKIFSL